MDKESLNFSDSARLAMCGFFSVQLYFDQIRIPLSQHLAHRGDCKKMPREYKNHQ